jgi:Phage integrase family
MEGDWRKRTDESRLLDEVGRNHG